MFLVDDVATCCLVDFDGQAITTVSSRVPVREERCINITFEVQWSNGEAEVLDLPEVTHNVEEVIVILIRRVRRLCGSIGKGGRNVRSTP